MKNLVHRRKFLKNHRTDPTTVEFFVSRKTNQPAHSPRPDNRLLQIVVCKICRFRRLQILPCNYRRNLQISPANLQAKSADFEWRDLWPPHPAAGCAGRVLQGFACGDQLLRGPFASHRKKSEKSPEAGFLKNTIFLACSYAKGGVCLWDGVKKHTKNTPRRREPLPTTVGGARLWICVFCEKPQTRKREDDKILPGRGAAF